MRLQFEGWFKEIWYICRILFPLFLCVCTVLDKIYDTVERNSHVITVTCDVFSNNNIMITWRPNLGYRTRITQQNDTVKKFSSEVFMNESKCSSLSRLYCIATAAGGDTNTVTSKYTKPCGEFVIAGVAVLCENDVVYCEVLI